MDSLLSKADIHSPPASAGAARSSTEQVAKSLSPSQLGSLFCGFVDLFFSIYINRIKFILNGCTAIFEKITSIPRLSEV